MSDEIQDASVWFDQFAPLAPEAADNWDTQGQWCPRHWAPCPQLGANGVGAALELLKVFMDEIATKEAKTPDAMNAQLGGAGYLCCTLGDERMYELWGHWPPSEPS